MISRQIASAAFSLAMSLVTFILPGESAKKEVPPADIAPDRVVKLSAVQPHRAEEPGKNIVPGAAGMLESVH